MPLDPDTHDRTAFSCGVEQVDNFFKKTANKLSRADNLRVFVMASPTGDVIGFYALNAHSVDYTELPKTFARERPAHGQIPAAFVSMIGVDKRFQGPRHGEALLVDCLRRIALAAAQIGIAVVMLDVLECGDPILVQKRKNLYVRYGFRPLASNPLRLYLPVKTVQALVDEADA